MNLCITKYHTYFELLQVPIYYQNEAIYLLFLLFSWGFGLFAVLHYLQLCPQVFADNILTYWIRVLEFYWNTSGLFMSLTIAFLGWFTVWRAFHLIVYLYAISVGLTLDEIYSPHHYSYLFKRSNRVRNKFSYINPNNRGFIMNWVTFFKQIGTSKAIVSDF